MGNNHRWAEMGSRVAVTRKNRNQTKTDSGGRKLESDVADHIRGSLGSFADARELYGVSKGLLEAARHSFR